MVDKIFINYRRENSAPHALNVAQYLEKSFGSQSIFIDIDRMRAGDNFRDILEDRLSSCKVMLVIIGPGWAETADSAGRRRLDDPKDWVRLEIARAIARQIVVVPVLVGGAELPSEAELPLDIQSLTHRQFASITTNNFRNDMAGLLRDIQHIRGRSRLTPAAISIGTLSLFAALLFLSYIAGLLPWKPSAPFGYSRKSAGDRSDPGSINIRDEIIKILTETETKRKTELLAQIKTEQDLRHKAEEEAARQSELALMATKAQENAQTALEEAVKDAKKYREQQAAAEAEARRQADMAAEAKSKLDLAVAAATQAKDKIEDVLKDAKADQEARRKAEAEVKLQAQLAARATEQYNAALESAALAKQRAEATAKQEAEQKQRQKAAQEEIERQASAADAARVKEEAAKAAAEEARRQQELKQVSVDAGSRQSEIDTAALLPNWSKAVVARGISVSPEGDTLATAYDDGYLRLWRLPDLRLLHAFNVGAGTRVNTVAFSPDGAKLASGDWEGAVKIWDLQTRSLIDTFRDSPGKVYSIAFFSGPQEYVASGHEDGSLKIWHLRSHRRVSDLRGPGGGAYAVAYRPKSDEFIYSIGRGGIRYVRSKGGHIDLAQAHTNSVLSLAFAANGRFFVSGGYDGLVKVWGSADRALLKEIKGHSKYVLTVAVSANSEMLATAGGDKVIKLWGATSGSDVGSLSGHSADVESVAFLLNGKFLISSSEDKTLRVWNVADKQQIAQVVAFAGMDGESYLVVSADGKFFTPPHSEQFVMLRIGGAAVPLSDEIRARRKIVGGVSVIQ